MYGYLRIRNSAPRYSIILLDEPELHLNPRLIRGLPQFYKKNLGEALGNQIWLVTHSDALLREVVGRENYNVFHMLPCGGVPPGESQLKPLLATADLELALVDLVGDLASYRPGGKVVIFEGGGDSDFDQKMTSLLFPEIQQQANLISGSNKVRVRALHETLARAERKGQLPFTFYAVTDKDSSTATTPASVNSFEWDVYHIENYLLVPKYLQGVLTALGKKGFDSEDLLWDDLRQCAQETLPHLLRHELSVLANDALVQAIDVGTDPKGSDLSGLLADAVQRSVARLRTVHNQKLTREELSKQEAAIRDKYARSLGDGTWTTSYRGRDVMKQFASKHVPQVSYEIFRNLVLSRMKDDGYRPAGMMHVIKAILA